MLDFKVNSLNKHMEKTQEIEVSILSEGITFKFPVEAFPSTPVINIINTVCDGFVSMMSKKRKGFKFNVAKWGLEMAPIWPKQYAEHTTVEMLMETAHYPTQLRLIMTGW